MHSSVMVNYHQAKLAVNTVFLQGVRTAQDVTPLQLKHIYQAGESVNERLLSSTTFPSRPPLARPPRWLFSNPDERANGTSRFRARSMQVV